MQNVIGEFKEQYRFLSNFYIAPLVWEGVSWPHSEAAYQAAKTHDKEVWKQFAKMTPTQAKRAGKTVDLRSDWEQVKVRIMLEIVLAKFTQNRNLADQLLATGDAVLEEGNHWRDTTWGICPANSGIGHNYLGQILMQVRNWIREND